ncbi:MAG: BON domain-containing protein [Deltaproteobacteria bacterium]|nr:BON domain-containing protein [Deltaproteobacteria bacterium]
MALAATPVIFFAGVSLGYDPSSSPASSSSASVAPDNSGKNVRDRGSASLTPFDQSNRRSDVEMTRQIRRALMKDKSLSTDARNIKVVTVDGNVTLRGPVNSEQEKAVIANKAVKIAGAGHVNDQLEVAGR